MVSCSRCSQIFDEKTRLTCPNCAAPLAPPPAPNTRVSLTGEVFETPAPAPPPVAPPYAPPGAYPPPTPNWNPSALPASTPQIPPAERNWLIGIGTTIGAVLLVAICFGMVKARQYHAGQTAFERESHLDLSTPQSTAKEALRCIKEQEWARFYLLTDFEGPNVKTVLQAEAFASSVKRGGEKNAAAMNAFAEKYGGMTDIAAAMPQINGQMADVAVSAMLHYGGKSVPLHGVAHLINDDEGKWRLNFSLVNLTRNNPQDSAALAKGLSDLLGLAIYQPSPTNGAETAPATRTIYIYPPDYNPDNRLRYRGRDPRSPFIPRPGYPNRNTPYPPDVPQPSAAPPQNPNPSNPSPQSPQPGTPAPSAPSPAPSQPTPTNPSSPAPSDPKPNAPNQPGQPKPPAPPTGGSGSSSGAPTGAAGNE